ncbi:MAG: divalent-cation tolerance protein CutA [Candidatus Thorarchaeota archaeon]|nr:divalent-cation tolerance protein CutA [Candidatus Thorarchaeota archaeon]
MPEYVVALTTCPIKNSKELARTLVEKRVCACVNIIPKVTSIYHWKDEIVEDSESLLIMKTDTKHIEVLWEAVKKDHPYEVPEYVILPIEWGSQDYLAWISQNVKSQ